MKRSRIKPVSDKRLAERPTRDAIRAAALARDHGCVAAGVVAEVACGGRLDCDEWDLRSALPGGHLDLDNVQTLCRNHHAWKHTHPIEAAAYGLRPYPVGYIDPEATDWRLVELLRADRPPDGE